MLMAALMRGQEDFAKSLVLKGVDCHEMCFAENVELRHPILVAADRKFKDVLGLMLDHGADINVTKKVLHSSLLRMHCKAYTKLIKTGENALHITRDAELIKFLISKGCAITRAEGVSRHLVS